MAQEIEAKFQLADKAEHDQLRRKLEKLKAPYSGQRFERNKYFDTKCGRHQQNDEVIRVREISKPGHTRYVLCHKGKTKKAKFKTRPEVEVEVQEGIYQLLDLLWFKQTFEFEKVRRVYHYKGCEIVLDILPAGRGERMYFCEIEGPTEKRIEAVKKKIGYEDAVAIHKGYPSLLKAHRGKSLRKFTFST